MKILVETLKSQTDSLGRVTLEVVKNLTEEILSKDINEATTRAMTLKNERNPHKIRVHECYDDEPDETRQSCKILFGD